MYGYTEKKPLPLRCKLCTHADCHSCNYAGNRWQITREYELETTKKGLLKQIERINKKIALIDTELEQIKRTAKI